MKKVRPRIPRARLVVLAVALTTLTVLAGMPAHAAGNRPSTVLETGQVAAQDYLWLKRAGTGTPGLCLVTQNGVNGNPVFTWTCSLFDDQRWTAELVGSDGTTPYWRLRNLVGGKCLVAQNFGANAHKAFQYTCLSYPDQHWYVRANRPGYPAGYFQLVNRLSLRCLTGDGSGAQATTTICNDTAPPNSQVWFWYVA
jgi:hypothetical protein